ncbi:MAG: DUF2442 domain-containing protein [Paludibacteraceae bacterium]|nr:DUF2442 domain-containing protein [Paludibacteraceae bacterium]
MTTPLQINKVWIDDNFIYAQAVTGETASYCFNDWQSLRDATPEQRAAYVLSYGGIHWPALDEDLSFEGMFEAAGICQRGVKECNVVCLNNNIIQ